MGEEKRHKHVFTALPWHFGQHGDQGVHVHSCFTEGCDCVMIGQGRKCGPDSSHRRMWLTEDGPKARKS